jgi:hypothetical protein
MMRFKRSVARRLSQVGGHGLTWRLAWASAAVLMVASRYSNDLIRWLIPVWSSLLHFLADDFQIVRFGMFQDRNDSAIAALALLDHTVVIAGRAVLPDVVAPILVSSTVGTVLQGTTVALVTVLAWPAPLRQMLPRLVIATALIAAVLLVETPLSMAARIWTTLVRAQAPEEPSPWAWWSLFMNGGGRMAIGLLIGAASIALARAFLERSKPREPQRLPLGTAAPTQSAP